MTKLKVPYDSKWHGNQWYEDTNSEINDMNLWTNFHINFHFKLPQFSTGMRNPKPFFWSTYLSFLTVQVPCLSWTPESLLEMVRCLTEPFFSMWMEGHDFYEIMMLETAPLNIQNVQKACGELLFSKWIAFHHQTRCVYIESIMVLQPHPLHLRVYPPFFCQKSKFQIQCNSNPFEAILNHLHPLKLTYTY